MFKKTTTVILAMLLLLSTCFFSTNKTYANEKKASKVVYLTFDDGPNQYTPI